MEGITSAANIARSSNNVHSCTLFDGEFWLKPKYRYCYNHRHPQAVVNVEFAYGQTSRINVCACRARMQQFPKFILCSTVAF